MSELEKNIKEELKKITTKKIIYKDYHFNEEKIIKNVPFELSKDYGELINFNTAYHLELLLYYMYENNIDELEYKEL